MHNYSSLNRLPAQRSTSEALRVAAVQPCGVWGNDKLTCTSVKASYEAETMLGHVRALLVLQEGNDAWRLLAAARDPISNGPFMKELPAMVTHLDRDGPPRPLPIPAVLVSPPCGEHPKPPTGQRFGNFRWRPSPSDDVIAEIAEFAYHDDARLFLTWPEEGGEISAGRLWTTRGHWWWRVWSITRAGDVVFSEARTFLH